MATTEDKNHKSEPGSSNERDAKPEPKPKGRQTEKGVVPKGVKIEPIGMRSLTGYGQKCSRTKADGKKCGSWAVRGGSVCAKHGGNAPKTKANGIQRRERAKVERIVETMRERGLLRSEGTDLHPLAHLLNELYLSAGVVAALGEMVGDLEDISQYGGESSGREEHVIYRLWSEERDRHASMAMMCLKAGVAERQIMIAEQQAALVATAIRGILTELGVAQDPRAAQIVRRHLLALSPSATPSPLSPSPAGTENARLSEDDKQAMKDS